jgi:hypothetical protein
MTGNFHDRLHKNPGADKTKKLWWCAIFSGAVGINAHINIYSKRRIVFKKTERHIGGPPLKKELR